MFRNIDLDIRLKFAERIEHNPVCEGINCRVSYYCGRKIVTDITLPIAFDVDLDTDYVALGVFSQGIGSKEECPYFVESFGRGKDFDRIRFKNNVK